MCTYAQVWITFLLTAVGWSQTCYGAVPAFVLPSSDGSTTVAIDESTTSGSSVYTVSATDIDPGTITFTLLTQVPSNKFQLNTATLSTNAALDYETEPTYTLTIQAVSSSTNETSNVTMIVNIGDVNDETPVITGTFTANLNEEVPVGTVAAGPFTVTDQDAGDTFSYTLSGSNKFQFDSSTLEVKTAQVIDFEAGTTSFSLTLRVSDSATTPHTSTRAISITLNNVNDNTPTFSSTAYFFSVAENSPQGISVAQLTATDLDVSDSVTVAIQSGDDATAKFTMNNQLIETSANPIDYDSLSGQNFLYTLVVTATDGTTTGTTTVYVTITGLNEFTPAWGTFAPAYPGATSPYGISENSAVGTTIVTIAATDNDAGTDGEIIYVLGTITASGPGTTTGLFNLDRVTGVLTTTSNTFDRDTATGGVEYYDVVVKAIDQGLTAKTAERTVRVGLTDYNDNAPTFSSNVYTLSIAETAGIGSVFTLTVNDDDESSTFTYSLTSDSSPASYSTHFELDGTVSNQINLKVSINLDPADNDDSSYSLVVTVTDGGTPELTGTTTIAVIVNAVNDDTPTFTPASFTTSVSESAAIGDTVFTMAAVDTDGGNDGTVKYSITGGNTNNKFNIDALTGVVRVAGTLDFETGAQQYVLSIKAQDGGSTPLSSIASLTIDVTDVSDEVPTCTTNAYSVTVTEPGTVGTVNIVSLACSDSDATDTLVYTISSGDGSGKFSISTAGVITLASQLDFDSATQSYALTVQVSDGTNTLEIPVNVQVDPTNEHTPMFGADLNLSFDEDEPISTVIATHVAADTDFSPHDIKTYQISSVTNSGTSLFSIDQASGDIRLVKAFDYESITTKSYVITVFAIDGGSLTGTGSVTVTVNDVNDVRPSCSPTAHIISVTENTALNSDIIADFSCTDADSASLTYTINSQSPATHFTIDTTTTPKLVLASLLDYETNSAYDITVTVSDGTFSTTINIDISVTDINEVGPVFTLASYTASVAENTLVGTSVITVPANDPDSSSSTFGNLEYSFIGGNGDSKFLINPTTGVVSTGGVLNAETTNSYNLVVQAIEEAGTNSATVTLVVTVTGVNDNPPTCSSRLTFTASLAEEGTVGDTIHTLVCTDADGDTLTYTMTTGDTTYFIMTANILQLVAPIDYDTVMTDQFSIIIQVSDGSNIVDVSGSVTVTAVNEHSPTFPSATVAVSKAEGTPPGSVITTVVAIDADRDESLTYSFVTATTDFTIDQLTGQILLAGTLDRETNPTHTLTVQGSDGTSTDQYTLTLTVTDINDNTPVFNPQKYSQTMSESASIGATVVTVTATDADDPGTNNYGTIQYSIISGDAGSFTIDTSTGVITTAAILDYETTTSYTVIVQAIDSNGGSGALSSTAVVTVNIDAVNEDDPTFTNNVYTATIGEDTNVGQSVLKVIAADTDHGNDGIVTYSMATNTFFYLDTSNGDISVKAALDYDTSTSHSFEVVATDSGITAQMSTATVTITITDVNDNTPSCSPNLQTVSFSESTPLNTNLATLTCMDRDNGVNAALSYTIQSVTPTAAIFEVTNAGLVNLITTQFDYESQTSYSVLIEVNDGGTPSFTTTVTLKVDITDVNEANPIFTTTSFSFSLSETTSVGTSVYSVAATDADTANTVTYSFNPPSTVFDIDSTTGIIYTIATLDYDTLAAPKEYEMTVYATDDGTGSLSVTQTVTATLLDNNDGTPFFSPGVYSATLAENEVQGTTITTVTSTDIDDTTLTYSLADAFGILRIDTTGEIILDTATQDYETTKSYTVVVYAVDANTNTGTATVHIEVTGVNEHDPIFTISSSAINLEENSPIGSTIITIAATDSDDGEDGTISYSLSSIPAGYAGDFAIGPSTGSIIVTGTLDMETVSNPLIIKALATDGGTTPARSAEYTLTLTLTDENDNTPSCSPSLYSVSIAENIGVSISIAQLTCTDLDTDNPNNVLAYTILSGNTGVQFDVDVNTGQISTSGTAALDRETLDNYQLLIQVADTATSSLSTTTTLTVTVADVNDNNPAFGSASFIFSQTEDAVIGTTIGTVVAEDDDINDAGNVEYSIFSGNDDLNLAIDSNTGDLRLIAALDYETTQEYQLIIYAIDKGATRLTGSTTVTLSVTDVNDNYPVCTNALQTVSHAEDTLTTMTIATVSCTDLDTGVSGAVSYSISTVDGLATNTPFNIDPNTGVITLATNLDYETDTHKQIVVHAIDGGSPALTGSATVNVAVTDINEATPLFGSTPYAVSLAESTPIGQSVYVVTATDADTSDTVTYSLSVASSVFEIDSSTGEIYLKGVLDFEGTPTYTLTVVATDDGTSPSSKSSTETLTLTVTDANDGVPVFNPAVYVGSISENDPTGTTVTTVTATDADGTTPTYSIGSGNDQGVFRIETSGVIVIDSLTNLDYDSPIQSYTLVIEATDGTNTGSATVAVAVTNYNDNPPVLASTSSTQTLAEDTPVGNAVVTVVATDADSGMDGNISYSISAGNTAGKFAINPSTGQVTLAANLDIESTTSYTLTILATDAGINPSALSTTYVLTVTVTDVNDVIPVCTSSFYSATLAENSPATTSVVQLICSDGDAAAPNNDINMYFIASANTGDFTIGGTGEVTVVNSPNRESTSLYTLIIHVIDGGNPALTATTTLAITITDENDNTPMFASDPYSFNSDEDTSVGIVIGTVSASDADLGRAGSVIYTISSGDDDSKFGLDATTGQLKLVGDLDYETATNNPYVLVIQGRDDDATTPLTASTTISLIINDKNDNTPLCTPAVQAVQFPENTGGSITMASIACTDADSAPNAGLTYEIVSVNGVASTLFNVDGSGVITTAATTTFDYEATQLYAVLVRTKDSGTPSLSFTSTVNVLITDVNEHAPVFQSTPFSTNVPETTVVGSSVYQISALDADTVNTITYTINPSSTYFQIDPATGIVYTTAAIDYDTITLKTISVTLVATDNGVPSQSATGTLTVTVTDSNDGTPVFSPAFYAVSVSESEPVGYTLVTVTATDIDDTSLTFSFASGNGDNIFGIDPTSGVITITDVTNFDYDSSTQSYTLVVRAVDAAPNTASTTVVVDVTNVNDNVPTLASLSSTQTISENEILGATIFDVDASDADYGEDGEITYTITSVTNGGTGKFSVDPTTGIVTLSGSIDRETVTSYILEIQAADQGAVPQSSTFTLTVSISDENDVTPSCTQSVYSASVSETDTTTTSVAKVTCTDNDATAPNNVITSYTLTSAGTAFLVSASGDVTVNSALDRETLDNYALIIEVADSGTPALTTTTTVTITVTDENDNAAVFPQDPYNFNQAESISVGIVVGTVTAEDADSGANAAVIYSIASGDIDSKFQIDTSTGSISTTGVLDFETAASNPYTLVINAEDGSANPQTSTTSVIITLSDVNDNSPVCTPVLQTVSYPEDTPTASTLVTLVCTDSDSGVNADLSYDITLVNAVGTTTLFSIDTSGAIRLTNALDYEIDTLHAIVIEVSDGGTGSLTTTVTVNVQVTDVNDNTPIFTGTPYSTNVIETTTVGTSVFRVTAGDADITNSITFSVNPVSAKFDVDPSTGEVFLKSTVDYETTPTRYEVIVVATDDGTNPNPNSASATVTLDITNFNDGTPEFNPGFYAISVRENTAAATSVLTVTVTDIDDTTFTYNIVTGNGDNIFGIAGTTTTPVLNVDDPSNLDYETTKAYTLVISATDTGGNIGSATIEVTITNYNEHTPTLSATSSTPSIPENSVTGITVADVDATDVDDGVDGDITYTIVSGSSGKFAIDPASGLVTVSGSLDREVLSTYTVVIHAVDAGIYPGELTATYSAVITITDVNDFSPVCSSSLYSVGIAEDSPIGTSVAQLICTDADADSPNNVISTYGITSGNTGGEFLISASGEVTSAVLLDREMTSSYELVIVVTDSGTTPSALSTTTTLTISVTDVNDHDPTFSLAIYNINIDETTALHTSIGHVTATDADIDLAGSIVFSIVSGNGDGKFGLDKTTGDVTLVGALDYETTTTTPYVLEVNAIDRQAAFRTGTATISITVNDINDNAPTCTASLYTGTAGEDAPTSTSVATVVCSDVDTVGTALSYSITSTSPEFITAVATSGEITTASALDYETATSHDLTVQVTDGLFTEDVSVTITVTNVNDEDPVFDPSGPYTASIDENVNIGTTVYDVNAIDADAAGTLYVFSITSGNDDNKFKIGASSGIIQVQQSIDRDDPLTTSYTLSIEVADQSGVGARTATTSIVISITDLNDNYPACDSTEYVATLLESSTIANIITPVCSDLDVVASPTLLFAITGGNDEGKFQIGTGTGVLSRIASLDYETTTSYTLTVTVSDQGTPTPLTSTLTMIVYVDPVNEHTPVFQGTPYDTAIDEDVAIGYAVGTISATDADTGSTHGTVRYSIISGNFAGHFSLNPSTGVLSVASNLDRETTPSYTLTVAASDMITGDAEAKTVTETFTYTINDVNDNYPQINPSSYTASLNEHVSGTLTSVLQITASDDDDGNAGTAGLIYSIEGAGNTLNVFQMNGNTLELNGNIDANTKSIYTLTVKVADQGTPVLSAFTYVSVFIVATNDHAPTFSTTDDTVTISESETIGNSIYQVAGADLDTGTFSILRYYLRGGVTAGNEEFTVDKFDGTVRVANQLDYDTTPTTYTLNIQVEDTENSETDTKTATATLTVSLTDFNDETPICTSNTFTGSVDENVVTGQSVVTVAATDNDSGINGQITYTIVGGSGSSTFGIDPSTGVVTATAAIDYETTTLYDLEVQVNDGGTPTLSSSCLVRVTVNDLNDNTPVLLSANFAITVLESISIGTTLDTVQATDADSSANNNNIINFSLSTASAFFTIGTSSGILATIALLDRETLTSHTLIIYAADQGTVTQNTATTTYTIVVSDINDNDPTISNAPYDATFPEDTPINTVVHTLTVTDADIGANAVLTYMITNGNTDTDFRIDSTSGLIQVVNTLDRERTALYQLEVTITDGGATPRSVIMTATVSIGDINDNNPIFQPDPTTTYMFSVPENVAIGTVVDSVSATDADTGSNAAIVYVVGLYVTGDSTHFNLNTATGEITTAGNLDRETQDIYVFIVTAMDQGSNTLSATTTVSITITDVNDNIPSFGSTLYTATIVENSVVDTSIVVVVFSDLDTLLNDDITLTIDTGTAEGARADTYIHPNSSTSTLYVKLPMDRETDQYFNFTLVATDQGTPPLSFSTSVIITVGDENDNAPLFSPTFYNSEIAYNDNCQITVTTITATDADLGVNAVIEYYTTLNNNPHIFSLDSSTGVVSMVANAVTDTGYVIYAAARDSGSPQLTSSIGATIRVDTYTPGDVVLNYYMSISQSAYLTIESTFLNQLTTVYQVTYPTSQAKRWCVGVISSTSIAVRIYIVKDDTADEESEINNEKQFLTATEAYTVTAADVAGTPAAAITGISWTQFVITRVEKYSDPDTSSTKAWIQTAAGIAVVTVAGVIGALLIGGLVAYTIWYCRKPPIQAPRNRVQIGDDDGGDTVAKNQFNSKNNTIHSMVDHEVPKQSEAFPCNLAANDTTILPYDKNHLPPAVVALPMPSATKRVPMQSGNKAVDKRYEDSIFNAPAREPVFEKRPEKLRRGSPVPTETTYSPASHYRANSPFYQSEINYPVKRLPPTQRPQQRPQRLEDSELSAPDSKSNFDESEYKPQKRTFDGRAVDPVTGRVYEYNTKTNERQWVTSSDRSPVKQLVRDEL